MPGFGKLVRKLFKDDVVPMGSMTVDDGGMEKEKGRRKLPKFFRQGDKGGASVQKVTTLTSAQSAKELLDKVVNHMSISDKLPMLEIQLEEFAPEVPPTDLHVPLGFPDGGRTCKAQSDAGNAPGETGTQVNNHVRCSCTTA